VRVRPLEPRRAESDRLLALTAPTTPTASTAAGPSGTPTTVLISGMAGVGKTALAVRWAHGATGPFPDGRFHLDLRGFDPAAPPVDPSDALRTMLGALGVPAHRLPGGTDALTGLYRSLLAGRRILLLLDDAHDTAQVRPLLPPSAGSLALVTSRHTLPGLVASGAHPLRLEPPSADDARAVLARRLGAGRVAADPAAADEIVARCGRLPLALAVVAARAADRPEVPLGAVAAGLRSAGHGGLDAFSPGDGPVGVRGALACSYARLPAATARLFRLLALHPGPDITAGAAAALAALPVREARLRLGELADAHLAVERASGRHGLHVLVRAFAAELTSAHDTAAERLAARHRLSRHHLVHPPGRHS
jgi:hypothetical protein